MSRTAKTFERRGSIYEPTPDTLIICEDSGSNKTYIEDAKNHFKAHPKIEVCNCGKSDTVGIVNYAKKVQHKYHEIYCVVDRDSHYKFEQTLAETRSSPKIKIIPSYPCFEFWLLIHFNPVSKPYGASKGKSAGECVVQDLKNVKEFAAYTKSKSNRYFDFLLDRLPAARANAARLLEEAKQRGDLNPSTQVHLLIKRIEELGQLVKIT
ncbi:RloB family protein [Jeongeupia chitinilytica]|uniref:RloB domain-containing protein n=1 Tax=Jeongeupia chitinilytica TaxID=1041641 RepID=A0ABQ3H443_9NEIS|nr:RloB family protein [Jeongeupia chitinilytica]GHD66068.1 hypothetical protein GCM10007350_27710 [Jeongeupia chitinilytica]